MQFHQKPTTYVSHVTIKVSSLERSLSFYNELLGFKILERTTTTASLTTDGVTAILTLEQPDNAQPKKHRTTGLYHFAILLPTRKDLANFIYHSAEAGLALASADHLVSEALYFNDPDGNGIEVYRDRAPDTWVWKDAQVEMTVDPLDIEDLLKEGERGAWRGLPVQTVMGHIHLHVTDLSESKDFYEKGLGFETVSQLGNQALFISTGNYHHHIGLNTWNGYDAPAPAADSVGLRSFTVLYPDEEALIRVVNHLQAIDAFVQMEKDVFYTKDPSGNVIQLKHG
ncbi:VOC family protein [Gracilibacillus timonensis]|uniref:VOC family protein n=1 Tax=Gracilibacillus timonensis TaxID=1816696 RepID=UPI00082461FC|nr:VOC family protein [Gracilibacillus timonensis]